MPWCQMHWPVINFCLIVLSIWSFLCVCLFVYWIYDLNLFFNDYQHSFLFTVIIKPHDEEQNEIASNVSNYFESESDDDCNSESTDGEDAPAILFPPPPPPPDDDWRTHDGDAPALLSSSPSFRDEWHSKAVVYGALLVKTKVFWHCTCGNSYTNQNPAKQVCISNQQEPIAHNPSDNR